MKRGRAPLAAGHVRRLWPTACVAEPFSGSTADDIAQLQWLAKTYARCVPHGCDWPLERWAQDIGFLDGDHAAMLWIRAYERRTAKPDRAKTVH
jgi:hypothetical protein